MMYTPFCEEERRRLIFDDDRKNWYSSSSQAEMQISEKEWKPSKKVAVA